MIKPLINKLKVRSQNLWTLFNWKDVLFPDATNISVNLFGHPEL